MLEILCSIPESIGWALVGSLATLCGVMICSIGSLLYEEHKIAREEEATE